MAALAFCTLPATLMAQTEKENEKVKEKTARQQITIVRTGDKDEKTVIEIVGDKVKVNGKDVADLKDVQVHVNNIKMPNMDLRMTGNFNMDWKDNAAIARGYKIDSNRAMLGVTTEDDDKDRGASIQSITKESGAEKAGLKKGDVITKIDNRKIDGPGDVTDAIHSHKPGDKVTVTYLRDEKEYKATAELGRWKGIDMKSMTTMPRVFSQDTWNNNSFSPTPALPGMYGVASSRPKLGLSVQDTDDGKGVKVLDVSDEGTAAKAGIKEGDIITQIDDKAINGADEIAKLVKEKKDQPLLRFQVIRDGKTQNIEVKIPRKMKTADL